LAFEGIDKGIIYAGAISALEGLETLPMDINNHKYNQIKGRSGSSAGYISALFMAMGLGASKLQFIMNSSQTVLLDQAKSKEKNKKSLRKCRMVNRYNQPNELKTPLSSEELGAPGTQYRQTSEAELRTRCQMIAMLNELRSPSPGSRFTDPLIAPRVGVI
jgi:hypothetical protein